MFTGLIETIGVVSEYNTNDQSNSGGNGVTLIITDCSSILNDVQLGDSISTNGVCLTVTEFDSNKTWFKVGIAPETLRKSNLGSLKKGSKVNLERAVTINVRLGGHIVQGHVDTIATIISKSQDENAINFTFKLRDLNFINYIVHKGFISIDGTSLTVTNVNHEKGEFSIMLISYSQSKVILTNKQINDTVNIEVDLTGKLIEKQIEINLLKHINDDTSNLNNLINQLIDKKIKQYLNK